MPNPSIKRENEYRPEIECWVTCIPIVEVIKQRRKPKMHLLIPYIPLVNHVDPDFREFTYGDSDSRARKLRNDLKAGDFVFFHTTTNNKKYITAYYVVDRILDTNKACCDDTITIKYNNPHLLECLKGERAANGVDDVVLFGDPIRSNILEKPLLFDKKLSGQLSLGINFYDNKTDAQNIGSATRSWRHLTDQDKEILIAAIRTNKNTSCLKYHRSTEEVSQTLERDIEDHIAYTPSIIGSRLKLVGRQLPVPSGRIDVLLEDDIGEKIVVEVKLGRIGRDALNQIKRYIRELRQDHRVSGIIVCEGVLPAYEEELRKQKDVRVMIYGWNLNVQQWQ